MRTKWCMFCKHLCEYQKPYKFGLSIICVYCENHPDWPIKINSIVKGCKEFKRK